jgi:crotonobetainyl-CoA:carnitine CoA-transferase CaiB-like acyl-CoA transferase
MLLGSMGAEVLHVEHPDTDWSQLSAGVQPTVNGTSVGYLAWNMNKRSIFLDMKNPDDQALAHRIIRTCDVFVNNMRPGAAERAKMSYEELSAINPLLIYCSATGYGRSGPRAGDVGVDGHIQAISGFWSTQGARGGQRETYRHYSQMDGSTGNILAQAILLALVARKRTGKGQRVDVTMIDASATAQLTRLIESLEGVKHAAIGSSAYATAPDRAFKCKDHSWIGVSVTSELEWQRLCSALGCETLKSDERFEDNRRRVSNRAELENILVPIFAARTQAYWELTLSSAGIPFGLPLGWSTLRCHEQVIENGYMQEIDTPLWGRLCTGGPPWHFSKTPAQTSSPPIPGEATAELQAEVGFAE